MTRVHVFVCLEMGLFMVLRVTRYGFARKVRLSGLGTVHVVSNDLQYSIYVIRKWEHADMRALTANRYEHDG